MKPVLFEIGPFALHTYGLMVALGFLIAYFAIYKEHKRLHLPVIHADRILIIGLICGIGGAKIWHAMGDWDLFIADPAGSIFSLSGLVWYGGFLGGLAGMFIYVRMKRLTFLQYLDMIGLGGMIGYAIGRMGCHLSGDGDYGIPTNLPWGVTYERGIIKPSSAAREYFSYNPEAAEKWNFHELTGHGQEVAADDFGIIYEFDVTVAMHPTPVYEFLAGIIAFFILWKLRTRLLMPGLLFTIYLMLMSAMRFLVEFIRLNPRIFIGLSEAQIISIILFIVGLISYLILKSKVKYQKQ